MAINTTNYTEGQQFSAVTVSIKSGFFYAILEKTFKKPKI